MVFIRRHVVRHPSVVICHISRHIKKYPVLFQTGSSFSSFCSFACLSIATVTCEDSGCRSVPPISRGIKNFGLLYCGYAERIAACLHDWQMNHHQAVYILASGVTSRMTACDLKIIIWNSEAAVPAAGLVFQRIIL